MNVTKRMISAEQYRTEVQHRLAGRPALLEMTGLGSSTEERKPYQVAEGVAIIEITGLLTNSPFWWDETGYEQIQTEVKMAVTDPDVSGILLRINSPGGETENAFETALALVNAGKQKPLWAVADTMAYSAGYLLASTAQRIYVPLITGGIGSIGVYAGHIDLSGMLEKAGVTITLISAGKGKTDGNPYEPLSDTARKAIQDEVNRLYREFVGSVARNRGQSEERIRELGAKLFRGSAEAIGAGLADRAGLLDEAWIDLAAYAAQQRAAGSIAQVTQGGSMSAIAGQETVVSDAEVEETPLAETAADEATTGALNADRTEVVAEEHSQQLREDLARVDYHEALADGNVSAIYVEAFNRGHAQTLVYAAEVAELCTLAGQPHRATEFIRGDKPITEVRSELLTARAAADAATEIHSHVLPDTSSVSGWTAGTQTTVENSPIVQAARKVAQAARKEK